MNTKAQKQTSFLPGQKYRAFPAVDLPNRQWPMRQITKAPTWCSVDLRDGNQALINPMSFEQKLKMFNLLLEIGFKEIEIGFPSAAEVEFKFMRALIEQNLIPEDVTPQLLTQARAHLINRTFESLEGAKRAIVHLYNSTSTVQRRVVFGKGREEIKQIAVEGTELVKKLAAETDTEIVFQYSPESFTATELDFALEVSQAVIDCWEPTPEKKMILNLPATVELATPNIYADQIEWMIDNLRNSESVIVSLHAHNDRGCAVAATELAMMAGAGRVEGTLFGNGERTGNVDLVTVAMNLYTQGVDPELDLSDINQIMEISEECTELPVHPRHPYSGDLVFTAFSGSHQDAIKKGMSAQAESKEPLWDVPYLPIDPQDLGRTYEAIIRINSQSGKGGVAYVMENEFGCSLPKAMHPEFSAVIQRISDRTGKEILSDDIWDAFSKEYLKIEEPFSFVSFKSSTSDNDLDATNCVLVVDYKGERMELKGTGNGPIAACRAAFRSSFNGDIDFKLTEYSEHSLTSGADAKAVAYIQIKDSTGNKKFGVGIDPNINRASVRALISAINRTLAS